jgi:hypothetical protein
MWSTQDPVTVFGAMQSNIGAEEVRGVFRWLATRFSDLSPRTGALAGLDGRGSPAELVDDEDLGVAEAAA